MIHGYDLLLRNLTLVKYIGFSSHMSRSNFYHIENHIFHSIALDTEAVVLFDWFVNFIFAGQVIVTQSVYMVAHSSPVLHNRPN